MPARLLKLLCLLALPFLAHQVAGVPAGPALLLCSAQVVALCSVGRLLELIVGRPCAESWLDAAPHSYLAGWVTVPLFALASYLTGDAPLAPALVVLILLIAAARRKARRPPEPAPADIPVPIFLLALLFVTVQVALPFHAFNDGNLVREMFGDNVQRFSLVRALAEKIPPPSPFLSGAPLAYYWFSFLPNAYALRGLSGDLFAVWKCGQLVTAFFFVLLVWQVLADLLPRRAAAGWATALAFFAASFEVWVHPPTLRALAHLRPGQPLPFTQDPDHLRGLITTASDGLFMEDLLYIPHNTLALLLILFSLHHLHRQRVAIAVFAAAALAGFNPFFALIVYPALLVVLTISYSLRVAAGAALCLAAGSLTGLALCRIVDIPFIPLATLALLHALLLRHLHRQTRDTPPAAITPNLLRLAASAALLALLLLVLPDPYERALIMVLNYGPALLFGIATLLWLIVKPARGNANPGATTLLFLLVAAATFWVISSLLFMCAYPWVPAGLQDVSRRAGQALNLFNFYHKAGKLIRLSWALWAGVGISALLAWTATRPRIWRWGLYTGLTLVMLPALLTAPVRALTYLQSKPVAEQAAARYLREHGSTVRGTVVLMEVSNSSPLLMLAPISSYLFNMWTGPAHTITVVQGAWAAQYLPRSFREEMTRREAEVHELFADHAPAEALTDWLARHPVDYVLTRHPRALAPQAELVVDQPGACLYRVIRPAPGPDSSPAGLRDAIMP